MLYISVIFHSTVKIQPHLSQQEEEKELAQIWAGSHQVRVKLLGKTSALSFLVFKHFSLLFFTFTSSNQNACQLLGQSHWTSVWSLAQP